MSEYLIFTQEADIDLSDRYVLSSLAQRVIESCSDIVLQKHYFPVIGSMKTVVSYAINDQSLVNILSAINLQKLVYNSYINDEVFEPELFEKAIGVIDKEEFWSQKLNKINKFNIGLTGIAGSGLYLLNGLTHTDLETMYVSDGEIKHMS